MKTLFVVVVGYLLGSIPTGVLIVRRLRPEIDLRSIGSGNIGATNVSRALGARWGAVTMLGDCAKGLVPVLFARWIGASATAAAMAGIAAFLGHIYPIYLDMKGGKGASTALGVFLGLAPLAALLLLFIWVCAALIAQTTAVGALSAALALPILVIGTAPAGPFRGPAITTAILIAPFVFYTHRENIRRILRGELQAGKKAGEN